MTKEDEEEIRLRTIGYCLVCGSDELLVLEGKVTCLACTQTYTVGYFFGDQSQPNTPKDSDEKE